MQQTNQEGPVQAGPDTLTTPKRTNYWDYVRAPNQDCNLHEYSRAIDLSLGDVFQFLGSRWLHCGYYSAVPHVAALSESGERRVVAHVEKVLLLRKATQAEVSALLAAG